MALNIVSLNVNGLRDQAKRAGFFHWLRSFEVVPNIVCLQETHVSSDAECLSWFRASGYSSVSSPGTVHSCGCVMLFRHPVSFQRKWVDSDGRFLLCEFSYLDKTFRVCCLYAPNRNPARNSFLESLPAFIDPSVPTVLTGDFNTVFDRVTDRRGSVASDVSRESIVALTELFDACCCIDIWRYLHPNDSTFTWTRGDGLFASRIDLIGAPYLWVPSVSSCDIFPCPFSDHCCVSLLVHVPDVVPPGPGLWKLNSSILHEDAYMSLITNFWDDWRYRQSDFSSLAKWWDEGKKKIKGLTIRYCCSRTIDCNFKKDLLSRLAAHLKARIDAGFTSCLDIYHSTLADIAKLELQSARGAQVRARARWVEEGESSSAYFFRLEKKRAADRWIAALKNDDGSIVSDPVGISDCLSSFYASLFSAESIDESAASELLDNVSHVLPTDQAALCEGELSVEECFTALTGMARGKAPGLDGLPMEFYLKFWHVLGTDLVNTLNSCYLVGTLALSQRRGVISLVFKKGDRLDPRNWRPITLLNVDYKLAARALAGRLLKVIHLVVADDQSCGVPGRYIGENVALVRDAAFFATQSNVPLALLTFDQEKAFDRVDWDFMHATLLKMGFQPSFLRWINLFYHHVQSSINVNGYISPFFELSRGVRQGCPLSPLLYVLVAEVLACNIRCDPRIVGLSIPGAPSCLSPISQYADDTTLILSTDAAIVAALEVYHKYERGSGSKLNIAKSKGLWLGAWTGRTDPPVPFDWTVTKLKVLGVLIGPGSSDEDNWRPRIDAVAGVLNAWRARALSLKGKALVVNALALSRIWYIASLIYMPAWVLKELSFAVFDFFWKTKRELVARAVVVQPPSLGGFSVVDIRLKTLSLVSQWVKRFIFAPRGWSSFMSFWFSSRLKVSPVTAFSNPGLFDHTLLPPFYSSLLSAWCALQGSFSSRFSSLVFAAGDPLAISPVANLSTRGAYQFLLAVNYAVPHCVVKFRPLFGDLYWSSTWRQLHFADFDRSVLDFGWKVAHGVVYTAERLLSFGLHVPPSCFCGPALESLEHLLFFCPLAQSVLGWLQSLMFLFSHMSPVLLPRHVLFGFNANELSALPRVFVYMLNVCKFCIWLARNDFRFRAIQPGALPVIATVKARVKFHLRVICKRFVTSRRRRRFFSRQWCANGVIASFVDGSLFLAL